MATYRVVKGSLSKHPQGCLLEINEKHKASGHDLDRLLALGVIVADEGYEGEVATDLDGGVAVPEIPYIAPTPEAVVTPRAQSVGGGTKPAKPPKPPKAPSAAKKG